MEADEKFCHRKRRRKILEKKRKIDEIIKCAASEKDHLSSFRNFLRYQRNGLSVRLEPGQGDKISTLSKQYIRSLLKLNMEAHYGSEWPAEEKVKQREMVAPEARYIFVYAACDDGIHELKDKEGMWTSKDPILGFVQYRCTIEEEVPVLYVYELQLEPRVQGKGLGKFLMQLLELIAKKNKMDAVVLTVQKANRLAMDFYMHKLGYTICSISPSRFDPLLGLEKSYEILCKAFDPAAQAVLEVHSV